MLRRARHLVAIAALVASLPPSSPATSADADPPCLTREQARAKYPGAYLYWRTAQRCWYGRTASSPAPRVRNVALPGRTVDGNGSMARSASAQAGPPIVYPDLIPGAPVGGNLLTPESATKWPLLIDIDEQRPFSPWGERINGQFR